MADLPILFSGPMVRAILREIEHPGTGKTQTRRVLSAWCGEPPAFVENGVITAFDENYRPYRWPNTKAVGDRLYVREAWRVSRKHDATAPHDLKPRTMTVAFESGGSIANQPEGGWRPNWWPKYDGPPVAWMGRHRQGMHLPRWASRLTLEVTGVRVERLNDISQEDAIGEGIYGDGYGAWRCYLPAPKGQTHWADSRESFRTLWDSINGDRPSLAWRYNPWVAAYTFRPMLGNIDQVPA